jgi:hypothetical protein
MTIPLRHFILGVGFLLLGALAGFGSAAGVLPPGASLAHVHLLLAGWVCLTIMGAMTQFVPVWSGTQLHSRRLASLQLWAVVVGLLGFAGGLLTGRLAMLPIFGTVMVLGFWVFVYNVGQTLRTLDSLDVTERHFGLALGFFLLLTVLGVVLAVDLVWPLLGGIPVPRTDVVEAHATLAVFGAILTTALGALYQLGTMFTQTELHGVDLPIRRFEEVAYPVGVVALAGGRLLAVEPAAVLGGVLILSSFLGVSVILARRLFETQVEWTPMLSRYAVLAGAMALWALAAIPAWVREPLSRRALFGAPDTAHMLLFGVVGFVVLGTLYHIVPFIVWVHRYSDLLGYEDVPMIDDLYSDRIAMADFTLFVGGGTLLTLADLSLGPDIFTLVGGGAIVAGALLFFWNLLAVVRTHSPYSVLGIVAPAPIVDRSTDDSTPDARSRND